MILANLLMLVLLGAQPLDFNEMVRSIEDHNGIKHRSLYGLGFLARAYVGIRHPAGASDLKFAIFDRINGLRPSEFAESVELNIHPSWHRIARRRGRDNALITIYAIPEKKDVRIFIVLAQPNNGVVMQFKLNPERFREWLDNRCEDIGF